MLTFSPDQLTAKEKYKILIGSVIPRPIAFVTTQSDEGVVNLAPFSYFNMVTYRPPVLSIAVQRVEGQMKDTARNIMANKQAVVHVVDEENVEEVNKTSAPLGPEESELEVSNFTLAPSASIQVPGIKEAKVRYETELLEAVTIYDEGIATADLILLKIVHYHVDEAVYNAESGYVSAEALGAVSRLAGNDYAKIGEIFSLVRPD